MPIDTRNKRGAVIGFKAASHPIFPNPDGSISGQADRQQMDREYPGILAGGASAFVPMLPLLGVG